MELITRYKEAVDELFAHESKKSLVTNEDFKFESEETIKIYKITTADMEDYDRRGQKVANGERPSRYGQIQGLDATTETFTLQKDRSFTYAIDALDFKSTAGLVEAGKSLARQLRQVVVPEVDSYVFNHMTQHAGTIETKPLTKLNIYDEIIKANALLDDEFVPETQRVLIMTPQTYLLLKQNKDVTINSDIGQDLRIKGVIGELDGLQVQKVPASRLPENFGFMIAHKVATCAPIRLAEYKIHNSPQGISGSLIEGRIAYGCFVLDNKKKAIYYHKNA